MRVLFITSNRIGDAVLSTSLLGALMDRHPEARFTVACGPLAAPLFAEAPAVERVLAMVKRKRGGHWLDLWRQTAGRRWDLVVDLRASAFVWTVRASRRLRLPSTPDRSQHRVRRLGGLLGLAEAPGPRLWPSPARRDQAAGLIPPGAPVLAIGPTANWGGKQWPAERFAALAARLTAADGVMPQARVAVFGAAAERIAAAPLLAAIPEALRLDLIGQDLATVAACLERARLYVGNDSGLMHMAAAVGVPTLGLFGPSPDLVYGPWGRHTAVVRTPESYRQLIDSPDFDHRGQRSLMTGLSVETVVAAAEALWRGSQEDQS